MKADWQFLSVSSLGHSVKGLAYIFCLYSHLPAICFTWQSKPPFWSIYQIKLLSCSDHSMAPHFTENETQTLLSVLQGLVWTASCPHGSVWPPLIPFLSHPSHRALAPLSYLLLECAKLVPTSGPLHILILHLPSSRYFYNCLLVIIQVPSSLSLPQRGHPAPLLQTVIISSNILLSWPHCT